MTTLTFRRDFLSFFIFIQAWIAMEVTLFTDLWSSFSRERVSLIFSQWHQNLHSSSFFSTSWAKSITSFENKLIEILWRSGWFWGLHSFSLGVSTLLGQVLWNRTSDYQEREKDAKRTQLGHHVTMLLQQQCFVLFWLFRNRSQLLAAVTFILSKQPQVALQRVSATFLVKTRASGTAL